MFYALFLLGLWFVVCFVACSVCAGYFDVHGVCVLLVDGDLGGGALLDGGCVF